MMYQRTNRRKIVIFCLMWCFANFNKSAAFNDLSQYGNSHSNCGSKVTKCTTVEETQIEKPPIKNLDVEPHSNEPQLRLQTTLTMVLSRQKRSDRVKLDVSKQEKGRYRQEHEDLSCLLVEEMTSKSKKSSSNQSGATRASVKRSRKQSKQLRASSNPTSLSNPSYKPTNPSSTPSALRSSAQQSKSQNDPNDDILTSVELLRTSLLETSTLPDRNLLPQPRGHLLEKLFSNNAQESSHRKEENEKDVPNTSNTGETPSQDLVTFSTKREMEQKNQNTPAVPSTDSTDSLGIRNQELRTISATREMDERTEQNENVRTSVESGIQSQDLRTFKATGGMGNQNIPAVPSTKSTDSIGIQNQELNTFGATRGIDQMSNPIGSQNIRTFSDTREQAHRNESPRTSSLGIFGATRGLTSLRKKNRNHPNLELINELNQKNNQPITFSPLDYQHMSESDRDILKTLNDDSVKYSELSETYTDISHLLNSNCDSIIIGPSNDDDLFVEEHKSEDIADDFEERDTENVDGYNALINLLFIK